MPHVPEKPVFLIATALALVAARASAAQATCAPAEVQKLLAADGAAGDELGYSVAIGGALAVVGARRDDDAGVDSGAAFVFEWNGASWSQVKKLLASDGAAGDQFGYSVAVDGDVIVVGAVDDDTVAVDAGSAYIFERDLGGPDNWGERKKISGTLAGSSMGWTVIVKDDLAVVGAVDQTPGGAAYLLRRNLGGANNWGLVKMLTASDADDGDRFTRSAAISGDTLLIAADGNDDAGSSSGSAYVFERNLGGPDNWGERKKLTASDPDPVDHFGIAVGLVGDTAVIAAHMDDEAALNAGAVYVHERDEGGADNWGEVVKLMTSDAGVADLFGRSLGFCGDTFVAGAPGQDSFTGSAYVFRRDLFGVWTEGEQLFASDGEVGDFFGWEVASDGFWAAVGAPQQAAARGAGYILGGIEIPSPVAYCTAGTSASGCSALLSATGAASATASTGFSLHAATVEGDKDGLFFFGVNGRQANPWGNGTSSQCVVPPVKRAGLLSASGTGGACDGSFSQDLNALWCPGCPKPNHNPGVGAVVQAQLWYRDPFNTGSQTTSLSDGLEFWVCP